MSWNARDAMSLKEEFVALALQPDANRRELCRRFKISPQTGYKWLRRFEKLGLSGLSEQSRRPLSNPRKSTPALEEKVITLRKQHPRWGGRKISHVLDEAVAPSTVTEILHRHDLILPEDSTASKPWHRFEHAAPNDLWQMDFKGFFQTSQGACFPLTMLDDHSRFNLIIQACANQRGVLVREHMTEVFRRYGLPAQINTDNGAPWGSPNNPGQLTPLTLWLVRLGIKITFSRPRHPQTNGKNERFHRSLKAEVLSGRSFKNLTEAQAAFDEWRDIYNHRRPHEALSYQVPMDRYQSSPRPYTQPLEEFQYSPSDFLAKVNDRRFRFKNQYFRVARALSGYVIAVRPSTEREDLFDVYFCGHWLRKIDLRNPQ
ncbi:IS481 family transposase, partial [Pseudomonas sp. RIT412]|uniref:IS481 family transposase n=3 Tax=unclassified Pseudomonas TaxID=196821 RepID=UPI000DCBC4E2